jgi:hypothetical protein
MLYIFLMSNFMAAAMTMAVAMVEGAAIRTTARHFKLWLVKCVCEKSRDHLNNITTNMW